MTPYPATAVLRRSPLLLCAVFACGCLIASSTTSTTLMGVKIVIDGPAEGIANAGAPAPVKEGPVERASFGLKWKGGQATVALSLSKKGDQSSPRMLTVNEKSYGTVNAGDEVRTDGVTVRVNGTVRNEEKPSS